MSLDVKSYAEEFEKVAIFKSLSKGFDEIGQLNPFKDKGISSFIGNTWDVQSAAHKARLGNESLGLSQMLRPAAETAWETVKNYRDPIAAGAVLGTSGLGVGSTIYNAIPTRKPNYGY